MNSVKNGTRGKHTRVLRVLRFLLEGCLAFSASANAQQPGFVFTKVDCPGAVGNTRVTGINDAGEIVGNCSAFPGHDAFMAFRQSNGTYAFTPLPTGSSGIYINPWGINDDGAIVGEADAQDGTAVGFVLNGSTYTYVSHPSFTFTALRGINTAGLITGQANNVDGSGNPIDGVGFIYDPSTGVFTDITIPNTNFIIAQGINSAGQVVGEGWLKIGGNMAFLRDLSTGVLSYFTVPNFTNGNGRNTARARGITDAGLMAGYGFDQSTGTFAAWAGDSTVGYQILHSPAFDPTTTNTIGEGLNSAGQISGYTQSTVDGSEDGFVILPLPVDKDQCKKGGWQIYGVFRNQGDCVSYVATNGKN